MTLGISRYPSMQPAMGHQVILASAGSGKTFSLTSRYLKLLRAGASPETIVATTFTRHAAGEILGRLLQRLARAARDDDGAAGLAKELEDPTLDLATCRRMLAQLAASMHRVSIFTIDGFFNRMASSFRLELQIPPDAAMVGSDDPRVARVRRAALDAMLREQDPAAVLELLQRLNHDRAERSIARALDAIVARLYEIYRQNPQETLWTALRCPALLSAAEVAEATEGLEANIPHAPHKGLGKGLVKTVEQVRGEQWDRVVKGTVAAQILAGEQPLFFSRKEIPEGIVGPLRALVQHAQATLLTQLKRKGHALWTFLSGLDHHYVRLRRAQRLVMFSDLPHALAGHLDAPRGPFQALDELLLEIYFRLDARVQHLMLDEFQDTSLEQWAVLEPIAAEVAAHADGFGTRTFFCVGDIKQAIYGWRGGCADLLGGLVDRLGLDPDCRTTLARSYRSAQPVLDTVNAVFSRLSACAPLSDHPELTGAWDRQFEQHEAHRTDLAGYAELSMTQTDMQGPAKEAWDRLDAEATGAELLEPDAEDEADSEEDGDGSNAAQRIVHQRQVAWHVAQLAERHPDASVGLLVSTNEAAARYLRLLQQLGVDASGEGGRPLTDDGAVLAVLAALALADHPGHSAAVAQVLASPLAAVLPLRSDRPSEVARVSRHIREALQHQGYAATLGAWTAALAPSCSQRNLRRLTLLLELARAHDLDAGPRPTDFVDMARSTAVEEPSAARVRVMTIHKSKGLEFDLVVLPELDRPLGVIRGETVLVDRPEPAAPAVGIYAFASKDIAPLSPQLQRAREQAVRRRLSDDLCGLYVAMTRARRALHMMLMPPGGRKLKLTAATILRAQLSELDDQACDGGGLTLYKCGDRDKCLTPPRDAGATAQAEAPRAAEGAQRPAQAAPHPCFARTAEPARRSWRSVSPSSLHGDGVITASDLLDVETSGGRQFGLLIHAVLERVEWLEDFPGEQTLGALVRQVADALRVRGALDLARVTETVDAVLKTPAAKQVLSRPSLPADLDVELWRERPFVVRHDGNLLRGIFDRVMITRREGHVQSVALVDFKTDTASTVEQRIAHYKPQIDAYRSALSIMLDFPARQIGATLYFTSAGVLREV